ncbi:MAG: tRNA (N(6)-L-threonylcarbamoyladenosine(37)-C(2))-methylthiotransferase MtaB [Lachnospiraceae bacterium]|nr:tRNA (N(6)-L-threonylcarbamoyladenosine(37)-C(2))-methylthiotransferase MtaB [Lachnospiraceae bacterium]
MRLTGYRIAFYTLGCKVNIYETELMQQAVTEEGAEIVPFSSAADFYIVNTCSVTNIADQKSRKMLHRAKKQNPAATVIACGCYSELHLKDPAETIGADRIVANADKAKIADVIAGMIAENGLKKAEADEPAAAEKTAEKPVLHLLSAHTRADIKVEDGCDSFCTYCIIPYARGRVRSRAVQDIVSEVSALQAQGVKEFVLAGIHVSSYGKDLPGGETLADLIEAVHAVLQDARLRLSSLEPRIMTEDFVRRIAKLPKLCPHFHLSLQSGCASVLKRMNRHYTPAEYAEAAALLRRYFGDPALTTDVIAGFPGETEEEFEESYQFIRSIGFYELHVFPYSKRAGTPAARMEGQVPDNVKKERTAKLIALSRELSAAYLERQKTGLKEVLTETEEVIDGIPYACGYTREYLRAAVPKEAGLNRFVCGVPEAVLPSGILKLKRP